MFATLLVALASVQDPLDRPIAPTKPAAAIGLREAEREVARLVPYRPDAPSANGAAVLVLPGGGYGHLAAHEGEVYAQWLSTLGFAAYVLEYRLGRDGHRHPAPLRDAAQALAAIRSDPEFPVDPERVGVIGSSAGGHLAATIAAFDPAGPEFAGLSRAHRRPDFAVLCYPVIGMRDPLAHAGSRRNLLGDAPDEALRTRLSIEAQVDAAFPPSFVWSSADDAVVSVRNSYALADALARAGVAHELHVFPAAPHGIGLGVREPLGKTTRALHPWARLCAEWLLARFGEPLATAPAGSDTEHQETRIAGYVVAVDGERVTLNITVGLRHLQRDAAGISLDCFVLPNRYKGELRVVEHEGRRCVAERIRVTGGELRVGDRVARRTD
ncbi:MAG: alpha/beta hydrolase [Planctomycetes bacterium]|nr:alpha/beta hydrolase [Planctomycetota bacterium]